MRASATFRRAIGGDQSTLIQRPNQQLYEQHRQRLKEVTSTIDNAPPLLDIRNFSGFANAKTDYDAYMNQLNGNQVLLARLNEIARTQGLVTPFNLTAQPVNVRRRIDAATNRLEQIEEENYDMGKRLLCAHAKCESIRPLSPQTRRALREKRKFILPKKILKKYCRLNLYDNPIHMRKLFRPEIYFKLEIKGIRPLGIFVIRLFTEAAPQVVLELVKLCRKKSLNRVNFCRLFPTLWLEAEVKLDAKSELLKNKIEYDKRVLDHESGPGILSFSELYLKGFRSGLMSFSISFKPLRVLNGRRIGFGQILQGMRTLISISEYGSKTGKPTHDIIVTDCGIYR